MSHPMKKDSADAHTAKMRRMTDHYGSASGAQNNLMAESNIQKVEGPERSIGFGAEDNGAKPRGDRPARRTTAANPVATYAKGGRVKRADGGDVSSIEAANRDQAESTPGRAMGGRMKHGKGKGHTSVNVIVAPQGAGGPPGGAMPMHPPVLMPPPGAGAPPAMPPKPPIMPPPGAGGPPGMPPGGPPMGVMPPGLPAPGSMPPHASGGRIKRADGGSVEKTLKDEGLTRSDRAVKEPLEGETGRARGGKVVGTDGKVNWGNVPDEMTAGAVSGVGRLEKTKIEEKRGNHKPQAV